MLTRLLSLLTSTQKDIRAILEKAITNLSELSNQVEPLVVFFTEILEGINHTADTELKAFLRPITSGITEGSSPDEVEALRVSQSSKKVGRIVLLIQ